MSFSYTPIGGVPPYTFSLASGALPTGVTLNADGSVTGTYTAVGSFSWVVQVQDSVGQIATLPDSSSVIPAFNIDNVVAAGNVMIAHRAGSYLRPEGTEAAYANALANAYPNVEFDLHVNAQGSMVISHDPTATYTTTSSANFNTLSDAQVAALTVDSGTWFGVTYPGNNIALFRDVAPPVLGTSILWPEIKPLGFGDEAVAEMLAAGAPTYQTCLSSFNVSDLAAATAAGYRTKLLSITTDILATAQANNITYLAYRTDAPTARFTQAVAAGIPVFAYSVNRRIERDTFNALGVSGYYSDDPEYVLGDAPIATTDNFAAQEWMSGMIPHAVDNSRPTLAERGRFFSPDYWGYSETADTPAFCLQGWACPIKGDPGADNYTIDLKITFDANSAGGTSRWAGMHIAAESYMDRDYNNEPTGNQGYAIAFRKNGVIDIFREDVGGFVNVGTSAGAAITTGTEHRFTVVVTPTQVVVNRHNAGGAIIQTSTANDAAYRGGYFHLGRFGMACKFRDIIIT